MSSATPNVIVVSGPSGTGKSTILERVLASVPGIRFSVSHTTRQARVGEVEGVHYHFVERPAFDRLVEAGRLLEWAEIHGHRSGTSLAEYERAERDGVDLLLDLDVQGAAQVRAKVPDAVTLFILPPSFQDLENRLRVRAQDDEASIRRRLQAAWKEVTLYTEYDYAVVNEDLDGSVEAVKAVIWAARHRVCRVEPRARKILATFDPRKGT